MKPRYVWVAALALLGLAACGSSSKSSSGPRSTTSTTNASQSAASTSSPAPSTKSLPAPCTLLTKDDVAPLFGTTQLDAVATTGPVPGTAQCAFGLSVGSQGLSVTVTTRIDYPSDMSYVFPQEGTTVAGIGDLAIVAPAEPHSGDISVKLGQNALVVHVEFYTRPVDNAFLIKLARDAVARV